MSVRRREWKTAKGEQKQAWVVDYTDQLGLRRLKTFKKKKEADAFAATTSVELRDGTHIADRATVTVREAGLKWIEAGRNAGLERTTIDQYRQHLDRHIVPFIGNTKLSHLSLPTVRAFADKLRSGENARSAAMVKKVLSSLSALLSDAQEQGLVASNVVQRIRAGRKRGKERQAERRQKGKLKVGVDIPTREEIKAIIHNVSPKWRPIIVTAIFTGLRASELRGLRWSDVDLRKGQIHVRQRADRYNQIGPPKSEAGERTIPVSPIVVNTLKELKLSQGALKDGDLVFGNGNGNVESHANIINRGLVPAQIQAGLMTADGKVRYTGLHALRHWYASWCINPEPEGMSLPPKVVQERLGHTSIVMTMDTYGHLFPRGDDAMLLAKAERSLLS